jgi:DNA-binding response OmpR family regulator
MNNNGNGPHILIVEDDNSLRDLFSEALESDSFKTSIASNGAEGIQMFDEVSPDLVLLDLHMPKMDG